MYLWYTGFLITLCISMGLLIKATEISPIGTAYAIWTGIGAVGTVLSGILVFNEPATFLRLLFLATLLGSIIGLKACRTKLKSTAYKQLFTVYTLIG